MKNIKMLLFAMLCLSVCALMGDHGKSIRRFPEIHTGVTQDDQCLECHHPDHATGPPCPHPILKGCITCHNDPLSRQAGN